MIRTLSTSHPRQRRADGDRRVDGIDIVLHLGHVGGRGAAP